MATPDDIAELLLSCRYGDTEDIQHFITRFGPAPLNDARDDNHNTVLHMVCANGHTGKPSRLVPRAPHRLRGRHKNPNPLTAEGAVQMP